jgi:hypothetical protein
MQLVRNIKCGDVIIDRGHYMGHVGAINGKNVAVVLREEYVSFGLCLTL